MVMVISKKLWHVPIIMVFTVANYMTLVANGCYAITFF